MKHFIDVSGFEILVKQREKGSHSDGLHLDTDIEEVGCCISTVLQ